MKSSPLQRPRSRQHGFARSVAVALGLLALAGCGPAPRPASSAEQAEAPASEPAASEPAASEPATPGEAAATEPSADPGAEPSGTADSDDGLDADIAALAADTRTGAAAVESAPAPGQGEAGGRAPAASNELVGRDIVYRVTPKGLVIEIDGVHLRPEAKVVRRKGGSYALELVLHAESFDGRQYWVNNPGDGPLSIAGKLESRGKTTRFADERKSGDGTEEVVLSDAPRRFVQRWPEKGQPKLWAGQTLTLEVGLWGVRADSERPRAVRRLFSVKMVAGDRAPAVISPPAMDWGS